MICIRRANTHGAAGGEQQIFGDMCLNVRWHRCGSCTHRSEFRWSAVASPLGRTRLGGACDRAGLRVAAGGCLSAAWLRRVVAAVEGGGALGRAGEGVRGGGGGGFDGGEGGGVGD